MSRMPAASTSPLRSLLLERMEAQPLQARCLLLLSVTEAAVRPFRGQHLPSWEAPAARGRAAAGYTASSWRYVRARAAWAPGVPVSRVLARRLKLAPRYYTS